MRLIHLPILTIIGLCLAVSPPEEPGGKASTPTKSPPPTSPKPPSPPPAKVPEVPKEVVPEKKVPPASPKKPEVPPVKVPEAPKEVVPEKKVPVASPKKKPEEDEAGQEEDGPKTSPSPKKSPELKKKAAPEKTPPASPSKAQKSPGLEEKKVSPASPKKPGSDDEGPPQEEEEEEEKSPGLKKSGPELEGPEHKTKVEDDDRLKDKTKTEDGDGLKSQETLDPHPPTGLPEDQKGLGAGAIPGNDDPEGAHSYHRDNFHDIPPDQKRRGSREDTGPEHAERVRKEKLAERVESEKKKPVDKKDAFKADTDGTFDEWLNKSRAIESGAKKLYEEAEKKVNALSQESKKPFETQLKDIKKRVDSISVDIANLEKEANKSKSESIQKAMGHFLAHYRLRAMIKTEVSEILFDIAKEESGDEVIKALKDFLVALERSPLI